MRLCPGAQTDSWMTRLNLSARRAAATTPVRKVGIRRSPLELLISRKYHHHSNPGIRKLQLPTKLVPNTGMLLQRNSVT